MLNKAQIALIRFCCGRAGNNSFYD